MSFRKWLIGKGLQIYTLQKITENYGFVRSDRKRNTESTEATECHRDRREKLDEPRHRQEDTGFNSGVKGFVRMDDAPDRLKPGLHALKIRRLPGKKVTTLHL
jgi:hypothetical protein